MLISVAWLREICSFPDMDPSRIAAVLTARGLTVDEVIEKQDDSILDIDVPANRPDWLGHRGVARELAAATGGHLLERAVVRAGEGDDVDRLVKVAIESPELCGRYTARVVRWVRVGPSPSRVVRRLEACGLRSINNVVDVSNLVLMELGQPIHTFDLQRVTGACIRVRRALPGEIVRTLDGMERHLSSEMLVIADEQKTIALAGVIGGADSEISDATQDVLIEAAWFDPRSVRATSRQLGIATDASQRFERGADPEAVLPAQELAASLLAELAGGTPAPGVLDVRPVAPVMKTLTVRPERAARLLGFAPSPKEAREALEALGMAPKPDASGAIRVTVPSWRVDLEREADLVEEIGRHLGYDRIPSRKPSGAMTVSEATPSGDPEEKVRDLLAHLGFHESCSYAMAGLDEDGPFVPGDTAEPLSIVNPISDGLSHLRRSLIPGLLKGADQNLRHGTRDVRLFEVGSVFLRRPNGGLPLEPLHVGIAWAGASQPRHWSTPPGEVGLVDVAGVAEALLRALRPSAPFERRPGSLHGFHPGFSMSWVVGGTAIANAGEVHPSIRQRMDFPCPVLVAEIDLSSIADLPQAPPTYVPLPRVPAVSRDLSLVVSPGVAYEDLERVLRSIVPPAPVEFELQDRYEGPPLETGQVSVTVRVILQPLEKTLTDAETETYRLELVRALTRELPVKIRT